MQRIRTKQVVSKNLTTTCRRGLRPVEFHGLIGPYATPYQLNATSGFVPGMNLSRKLTKSNEKRH